jgi:hypothetical protein
MDKLLYLFLLLILFVSSINTKLLLIVVFCFVGLCLYLKKKKILIIGLIIIYLLSILNTTEKFNNPDGKGSTSIDLDHHHDKEDVVNANHHHDKEDVVNTNHHHDKEDVVNNNLNNKQDKQDKISNSVKKSKSDNEGTTFSGVEVIDVNDDIVLTADNYSKIFFVLSSLLDPKYYSNNKESIDAIISNNQTIKDVFNLSEAILNINNAKIYNNFLERITCIKNGKIDYLDCDNINFKKLTAFSELIKIYTFSVEFVIELINKHKIYKLCDLESVLKNLINDSQYGYEYNGFMVYINKLSINNKYYNLLNLIGLDKNLDNQNKNIPLKERLYNYVDKNKIISKDLNSIVVSMDYYNILDDTQINNEEDDFNWDYSLLRNIDLNRNYWKDNPFFKKYNIKQLIINKINEMTKEDKNIFRHELNKKYSASKNDNNGENSENDITNIKNGKEPSEYKVVKNGESTESDKFLEKLNLKNIKNDFSNVFINIINDLTKLYNHRCKNDCDHPKMYNKFMYYFNNIIQIMIKDGRMFYTGLFVIFISVMLYFIESSK